MSLDVDLRSLMKKVNKVTGRALNTTVSRDALRREFDAIVSGSSEQTMGAGASAASAGARGGPGAAAHGRSGDSALARFTVDFTAQARAGKIDPVFGRDREIRQMVDILGRRRKNNPIVVGEAGVGKTAVVEGLALRIVQGDVPEVLQGVEILALDLGLLQAGAGVRGEFENRLKSVIDEVKASEIPVILFIDEAHTLIGAGGAQGGSDALKRDAATGGKGEGERLERLHAELGTITDEAAGVEAAWSRERDAARRVLEIRGRLAANPEVASLRSELKDATAALEAARDGQTYVPLEVEPDTVAKTVSDWTGIPLGNMVRDQAKTILEFETRLRSRIRGQDHALAAVGRALRASKAGIANPSAPMGVFMFVGPSGVGKTETALGIADLLFGGERFLTSVNMSEYQEKHTVSLLKGSPPGYVGYGEGGVLTEPVRQRPYSVVLLDEVEKAHPDVMNLFYQVFDKGTLTDATGRDIDFKNTIIVLTSNLGTDVITRMCSTPVPPDVAELTAGVKPALVQHFKPALNARWTVVPFLTIGPEVMKEIIRLKLDRVGKRLQEAHGIAFAYDAKVVDQIASRCTEVDTGARNVDHGGQ